MWIAFSSKKKAEKMESWSIEFAWQSQSVLPSPGRKKEINISSQSEKYPYVSLFPDLLCNIGWSVSGLRKIRLNAYTPRRISTKNQFPNKPVFPLPKLIILVWYPYVSLFPDLLCYRLECQRFTQNTSQRLYTPSNFHKKSVHKQTRIPAVRVDNFRWE